MHRDAGWLQHKRHDNQVNLTRWFALGLGLSLVALLGGFLLLREDLAVARQGYLPGVCTGAVETVVARGNTADLDLPIRRIIADNPREVVLLGLHTWMVAVDGQILGPFGSAQRGAPGYLGDAQDAALTDSAIYILDNAAHSVRIFTRTGAFVRSVSLRRSGEAWWQTRQVFVVNGEFRVTALDAELDPPGWSVLHWSHGRSGPARLLSVNGTSINGIVAVHQRDGMVVGEMGGYRFHLTDGAGKIIRTLERSNPPLLPFSGGERRRYRSYLAQLPPTTRAIYELPSYVPPLGGITQLSDDRFAALLTHHVDSVHVEILDDNATPLCRVTEHAVDRTVGLSHTGFFRVEETDDELILKHVSYGYANRD
jgi:hypothetical protein